MKLHHMFSSKIKIHHCVLQVAVDRFPPLFALFFFTNLKWSIGKYIFIYTLVKGVLHIEDIWYIYLVLLMQAQLFLFDETMLLLWDPSGNGIKSITVLISTDWNSVGVQWGGCRCSVAKSCWTFCDPADAASQAFLSFTTSWSLLTLMSSKLIMPSNHTMPVTPLFSCLQSFPASMSFPVRHLFASGGQSTGASASASVLPINTQGWFPLGLTVLISLLSKGLSSVRRHSG